MLNVIQKDIFTAMKAKDELSLGTLRMAKAALLNKEKDKREPLNDTESQAVLATLIKQRKDSAEQFTKGNRPELASKELAEITILEKYLPLEATKPQLVTTVCQFIEGLASSGTPISPKLMGTVIKGVKDQLVVANLRADGAMLSEIVKTELQNWSTSRHPLE